MKASTCLKGWMTGSQKVGIPLLLALSSFFSSSVKTEDVVEVSQMLMISIMQA